MTDPTWSQTLGACFQPSARSETLNLPAFTLLRQAAECRIPPGVSHFPPLVCVFAKVSDLGQGKNRKTSSVGFGQE